MRPALAAALLLAAAPACRAQPAPDLRAPTSDEMRSLAENCPENNRIVPAGTVVAYGEIFKAPLLVTTDKDRILVDGVQVLPRPLVAPDFQAQKIAARLHAQFYLDEKSKVGDASAKVERRLKDWKADRTIDDYQVWKRHGKLAAFLVKSGGGQARVYTDTLPLPLIRRYQFILAALFRGYQIKAESDGKDTAQAWLKARLDELKASGKADELKWEPERETARIRFAGENAGRDYVFGEDQTPFGLAYATRWKARRKQTETAAAAVAERLKADWLLIYARSFEKDRPADGAALKALEGVSEGGDAGSRLSIARERLGLTDEQARALGEELR